MHHGGKSMTQLDNDSGATDGFVKATVSGKQIGLFTCLGGCF